MFIHLMDREPLRITFDSLAVQLQAEGFRPLALAYPSTIATCRDMACGRCPHKGLACEPFWKPGDDGPLGECRCVARCPRCGFVEEV